MSQAGGKRGRMNGRFYRERHLGDVTGRGKRGPPNDRFRREKLSSKPVALQVDAGPPPHTNTQALRPTRSR